MADLWQGCHVWEKVEGGGERQTSTPDFVKRLLPDTDAACLFSALCPGVLTHRILDLTVLRAFRALLAFA